MPDNQLEPPLLKRISIGKLYDWADAVYHYLRLTRIVVVENGSLEDVPGGKLLRIDPPAPTGEDLPIRGCFNGQIFDLDVKGKVNGPA